MTNARWLVWSCALGGCPSPAPEPPPPVSKTEIVPAAPNALGALAAGTDAAPRPEPVERQLPPGEAPDEPGAGGQGPMDSEPDGVPL